MYIIQCQSLRRRRKGLTLTFVQRIRKELPEVILVKREQLEGVDSLGARGENHLSTPFAPL